MALAIGQEGRAGNWSKLLGLVMRHDVPPGGRLTGRAGLGLVLGSASAVVDRVIRESDGRVLALADAEGALAAAMRAQGAAVLDPAGRDGAAWDPAWFVTALRGGAGAPSADRYARNLADRIMDLRSGSGFARDHGRCIIAGVLGSCALPESGHARMGGLRRPPGLAEALERFREIAAGGRDPDGEAERLGDAGFARCADGMRTFATLSRLTSNPLGLDQTLAAGLAGIGAGVPGDPQALACFADGAGEALTLVLAGAGRNAGAAFAAALETIARRRAAPAAAPAVVLIDGAPGSGLAGFATPLLCAAEEGLSFVLAVPSSEALGELPRALVAGSPIHQIR